MIVSLAMVGCTSRERVAIELEGDFPTVREVDVILAAPQVYTRLQRTNAAPSTSWQTAVANEIVHYVAQRGETTSVMLGANQNVDQLRIQLASDDGASYLPIVIGRDEGGDVVAMGVYEADAVFQVQDQGGVTPEVSYDADARNKLKIYKIQLEAARPVSYDRGQPGVPLSGVMEVPCAGGRSGFVWRRAANQQLRVLLPLDPATDNAEDRLNAPNLDCDDHSAGIDGHARDGGDRTDCDDTVDATHAGARELCNGVDDDCDGVPGMVLLDTCANSCQGLTTRGLCDETQASFATQCARSTCQLCSIPTAAIGGGAIRIACPSRAHVLPVECINAKCRLTLAFVDPMWTVTIGIAEPFTAGLGEPVELDNISQSTGNAALLGIEVASTSMFGTTIDLTGEMILSVQVIAPAVLAPVAYHYGLRLAAPQVQCDTAPVAASCGAN